MTVFLVITSCSSEQEGTPAPNAPPLYVLGIDGATWDVIDPMIRAGELPNFARLRQEGAYGQLITVGPALSPAVWTTLATGHFGRRHGILDFVIPYTPGEKRPVESGDRLEPAVWKLASDAGKKVVNIGYYVSYPAERINGTVISNRSMQRRLPSADYPQDAVPGKIELLQHLFKPIVRRQLFDRYFKWGFDEHNAPKAGTPEARAHAALTDIMAIAQRVVVAEYYREVTRRLIADPADLFISYFRIVDYMSHGLWGYYDDTDFDKPKDADLKGLLGNALPESYRYMDEILGEILVAMPAGANLVVLSDHGSGSATIPYRVKPEKRGKLTGNHRPDGIFAATGPAFSKGAVEGLTIMEIAPLLFALLGMPVSDELPGRIPYEVLDLRFGESHPVTTTPRYHSSRKELVYQAIQPGDLSDAGDDELKSLQGLGYIGSEFEPGMREEAFDFWSIERGTLYNHLVGEIVYSLLNQDMRGALASYDECGRRRPELAQQLRNRVRVSYNRIQDRVGTGVAPKKPIVDFLRLSRSPG